MRGFFLSGTITTIDWAQLFRSAVSFNIEPLRLRAILGISNKPNKKSEKSCFSPSLNCTSACCWKGSFPTKWLPLFRTKTKRCDFDDSIRTPSSNSSLSREIVDNPHPWKAPTHKFRLVGLSHCFTLGVFNRYYDYIWICMYIVCMSVCKYVCRFVGTYVYIHISLDIYRSFGLTITT